MWPGIEALATATHDLISSAFRGQYMQTTIFIIDAYIIGVEHELSVIIFLLLDKLLIIDGTLIVIILVMYGGVPIRLIRLFLLYRALVVEFLLRFGLIFSQIA